MENNAFRDRILEDNEHEEIPDSFVCCVCLDLLYKPIVLCKAALFSRNTYEYVISVTVHFSLYLQLVVTYAVSGVSIIQ
ncbi:hypothetical protein D0Y65_048752 [Glycine soja]|uniref:Uncharacterized protein n=1 Tax=Glycine soja TaxID=3848 RepID=A0A445FU25_GLYSO|nr:hypothetical protein D0Y65_048752 [Glycine soja]